MAPATPEPPPLDVPRLVRVLEDHGVEYLLVGGLAAIAHGATRATKDFDCLVRRTSENLQRLAAAMRQLGARLHVEGLSEEEAAQLPVPLDEQTLAGMEISTWRTEAGDFDVLVDLPDSTGRHRSYDELVGHAESVEFEGVAVQAVTLEDLIASKEWANRPKDHEALLELRAIRDRSSPSRGAIDLEPEHRRTRRVAVLNVEERPGHGRCSSACVTFSRPARAGSAGRGVLVDNHQTDCLGAYRRLPAARRPILSATARSDSGRAWA